MCWVWDLLEKHCQHRPCRDIAVLVSLPATPLSHVLSFHPQPAAQEAFLWLLSCTSQTALQNLIGPRHSPEQDWPQAHSRSRTWIPLPPESPGSHRQAAGKGWMPPPSFSVQTSLLRPGPHTTGLCRLEPAQEEMGVREVWARCQATEETGTSHVESEHRERQARQEPCLPPAPQSGHQELERSEVSMET